VVQWAIPVILSILILGVAGFNPAFATPWGVSLSGNGFADSYTEAEEYNVEYNISGSYSFDINDNYSIQGSGTAQVSLHSINLYCTGDESVTVSYSVSGTYDAATDSVHLIISNSNPSSLAFTQHCDYPADPDYPAEVFDETVTLPSPFNFQHDFFYGLQMGVSASSEFSVGNASFWMGSDINSLGSMPSPADTTPPVISIPNDVTIETDNPSGIVYTYTVTVRDDTDPNPSVRCTPSSGSFFPVGITQIDCTATDSSGNSVTEPLFFSYCHVYSTYIRFRW